MSLAILTRSIIAGVFASVATFAHAGEAIPLDSAASKVTFVGESFLHNFHGEARDISGNADLDRTASPPLQKATLHFKTAALTTFHNERDHKMRDWLKIEAHPDATFQLDQVKLVDGDITKAGASLPAKFSVRGSFTFNGVKQQLEGSAQGWREKDRVIVTGDTVVDTLKHGLPQIREAFMTVGTAVKVSYRFAFVLPIDLAVKQ